MSTAFNRFLAGSDGLALLLRGLPAHAPPASMDAWFAQAARTADAERNAATPTQDALQFEAPSTMAAVFAAAAAQAEQAQAAQRAALQARLAQGERANQALGTELSASARAWIEQQARTDVVDVRPTADVAFAADASMAADVHLAADASITADLSASANEAAETSGAASHSSSTPEIASASASAARTQPSTLPALGSSSTSARTIDAATPRNSRRPRWMPTLAFAASITLAVGIGLQWQASHPTLDVPAEATPETAFAKPQEHYEAQRDANQVDRAADSTSDMPVLPAPAYAEAPNAAARPIVALPSPSSLPPAQPSPAPAFASEPVSEPSLTPAAALGPVPAPAPPLAAAPASTPPVAAMIAAEPAPSVDAPSIDAQAPAAPPPPPAPIAAIPEDARVSGSLAATANRSAPAPAPVSIAPDTPSAPASPPTQTSLIEQTKTDASVAETPIISRAAPVAGQAAPLRTRHAPTPRLDGYRDAPPSSKPTGSATAPSAETYQVKGSMARKPGLLNLSISPRDWVERYATSTGRMPAQIRLWAAKSDAPEVQRWAAQLRDQLKQRGWSTQVDVVQDTHLAADQLRLETFDTAQ